MENSQDQETKKVGIDYNHVYMLLGRLLTLVDATYTDVVQRKAQKDVVKQTVYGWVEDLYEDQYPDEDFFRKNPRTIEETRAYDPITDSVQ